MSLLIHSEKFGRFEPDNSFKLYSYKKGVFKQMLSGCVLNQLKNSPKLYLRWALLQLIGEKSQSRLFYRG